MYQTLEDLEYILAQPKSKFYKFSKIFKELKVLGLIFTVLFLWTYLITNAQLVIDNLNDRFTTNEVYWISENNINSTFTSDSPTRENSTEVEKLIKQYEWIISLQQEVAPDMNTYLQQNLDNYEFSFNRRKIRQT